MCGCTGMASSGVSGLPFIAQASTTQLATAGGSPPPAGAPQQLPTLTVTARPVPWWLIVLAFVAAAAVVGD